MSKQGRIEWHTANHSDIPQREFDIRLITSRRWLRFGAFFGSPPGTNMGLWHTATDTVHGWNYRVQLGHYDRCLTFLAHTRRESEAR